MGAVLQYFGDLGINHKPAGWLCGHEWEDGKTEMRNNNDTYKRGTRRWESSHLNGFIVTSLPSTTQLECRPVCDISLINNSMIRIYNINRTTSMSYIEPVLMFSCAG